MIAPWPCRTLVDQSVEVMPQHQSQSRFPIRAMKMTKYELEIACSHFIIISTFTKASIPLKNLTKNSTQLIPQMTIPYHVENLKCLNKVTTKISKLRISHLHCGPRNCNPVAKRSLPLLASKLFGSWAFFKEVALVLCEMRITSCWIEGCFAEASDGLNQSLMSCWRTHQRGCHTYHIYFLES